MKLDLSRWNATITPKAVQHQAVIGLLLLCGLLVLSSMPWLYLPVIFLLVYAYARGFSFGAIGGLLAAAVGLYATGRPLVSVCLLTALLPTAAYAELLRAKKPCGRMLHWAFLVGLVQFLLVLLAFSRMTGQTVAQWLTGWMNPALYAEDSATFAATQSLLQYLRDAIHTATGTAPVSASATPAELYAAITAALQPILQNAILPFGICFAGLSALCGYLLPGLAINRHARKPQNNNRTAWGLPAYEVPLRPFHAWVPPQGMYNGLFLVTLVCMFGSWFSEVFSSLLTLCFIPFMLIGLVMSASLMAQLAQRGKLNRWLALGLYIVALCTGFLFVPMVIVGLFVTNYRQRVLMFERQRTMMQNMQNTANRQNRHPYFASLEQFHRERGAARPQAQQPPEQPPAPQDEPPADDTAQPQDPPAAEGSPLPHDQQAADQPAESTPNGPQDDDQP